MTINLRVLVAVVVLAVVIDRSIGTMTSTACSGSTFSLNCGSDSYVIHVLYEQYSYSGDDKCVTNPDLCSQAEIIEPISAQYCNGHSSCDFQVPSGYYLEVCGNQNATSIIVHYNCLPKQEMVNICSPRSAVYNYRLLLRSPNYPLDQLNPTICQCNITGTNISALIMEYEKSAEGKLVFYFVIDKTIVHVGGVKVRNKILFQNTDHVKLVLDNSYGQLMFKLWMELKGQGMRISCKDQPVILPSSTLSTSTKDLQSSYPSETMIFPSKTISTTFVFTKINQSKLFSTGINFVSDTSFLFSTALLGQVNTLSATKPNQTHLIQVTKISTPIPNQTHLTQVTSSSSVTLTSSVIRGNISNGGDRKELSNAGDTDIRVIIVAVSVFTLVAIVSLAVGVFIYRKNHPREDRFNTEDNDDEVYHAYKF